MDKHELVITRVFDAPRTIVWQAWTDPALIVRWIGPRGFTGEVEKLEPGIGGAYRFRLREPDGTDHWMQGITREFVPPERLVNTYVWADAKGNPTGPETLLTIILHEDKGRTTLTLRQMLFETVTARDAHREGWNSSLDRLNDLIIELSAAKAN
ncbi:MAG TPA: SRPBCC domain-containing protein [Candidatus Binataceae bacterium]|nr:SRPBCC domain-containing protein [Candidatus Binataceae bacterium]